VDFVLSLRRKWHISERIMPKGFKILPKRWRVERTFGWLTGYRRLSKDYEISTNSEENMITILTQQFYSGDSTIEYRFSITTDFPKIKNQATITL